MKLPTISVIITYHNEGELLQQAIDSINSQTYKGEIEIVVVDDASENLPILPSNSRLPIRLIRSNRNIYLPAARNLGIRNSSGEFVAFLDADDVYLPEKIEQETKALLGWDDAVMVGGQGYVERYGITSIHQPPLAYTWFGEFSTKVPCLIPERVRTDICVAYLFHSCGFIVRRSALDTIGGFVESYRWGEEWDLQIRLAQIGRIGYVPLPGYRYIARDGSMTAINNPLKFESWAEINRVHRLAVSGLSSDYKRQMRKTESQALLLATQIYLENIKKPISAWHCARKSLQRKISIWGVRSLVRSTLHLIKDKLL
jgi:glycosyltransferase involved in cell wall biosynthesis